MSSLNPSALPFIPSQKQGAKHQSETDEASGFQSEALSGNEQENETPATNIDSIEEGHNTDNISDHAKNEDEDADEAAAAMDMDLNFLSTLFPNTSRESLADIYHASDGDLEASVEMMGELEDFGANKDLEPSTQKDETQKEGPGQACDVTGESSSSK